MNVKGYITRKVGTQSEMCVTCIKNGALIVILGNGESPKGF